MTTLEMISQISKNKNKVYRIKHNTLNFFPDTVYYNDCLRWDSFNNDNRFIINDCILKLEWEEVKHPVSFMDAMSALENGQNVYVTLNEGDVSARIKAGNNFAYLRDKDTKRPISTDEILKGKWYIEN